MIHFATVHFRSESWIDIQLSQIDRFTTEPHLVWACLNGIGARYRSRVHRSFDLEGDHPQKLNELAQRISDEAGADDLIVFIDGDAFPIADWVTPVRTFLETHPLAAVRRTENVDDPQPHPCFAVTTVGFWNEIGGDWQRGGTPWLSGGRKRTDAGGILYTKLGELGIPWRPILRSNRREFHPVLFAVYGDIVYHHGAAFRSASTRYDRWITGGLRYTGPVRGRAARWRLKRRAERNARLSEKVFEEIRRDPDYIRRTFLPEP
jgi:hypothetical protein